MMVSCLNLMKVIILGQPLLSLKRKVNVCKFIVTPILRLKYVGGNALCLVRYNEDRVFFLAF